jgi:hypothetical protein
MAFALMTSKIFSKKVGYNPLTLPEIGRHTAPTLTERSRMTGAANTISGVCTMPNLSIVGKPSYGADLPQAPRRQPSELNAQLMKLVDGLVIGDKKKKSFNLFLGFDTATTKTETVENSIRNSLSRYANQKGDFSLSIAFGLKAAEGDQPGDDGTKGIRLYVEKVEKRPARAPKEAPPAPAAAQASA